MKKLSNVFLLLAVLLSNVMCAVVAYGYCNMQHVEYSAPAYVAFFYAIPYLIAISVCIAVAIVLKRKER